MYTSFYFLLMISFSSMHPFFPVFFLLLALKTQKLFVKRKFSLIFLKQNNLITFCLNFTKTLKFKNLTKINKMNTKALIIFLYKILNKYELIDNYSIYMI